MKTVQQNYTTCEGNIRKTPTIPLNPEEIILAVDEGLSLLGQSAKKSIYFHLEKTYGIRKSNIPFMIEEFATALQKIFGPGSKIILIEILKKFHEKEQKIKSGKSHLKRCEPYASPAP